MNIGQYLASLPKGAGAPKLKASGQPEWLPIPDTKAMTDLEEERRKAISAFAKYMKRYYFPKIYGIMLCLALISCGGEDQPIQLQVDAGPVYWNRSMLPLMILLDDAADPWEGPVERASTFWNQAVPGIFIEDVAITDTSGMGDGGAGMVLVRTWDGNSTTRLVAGPTGALKSAVVMMAPAQDWTDDWEDRHAAHELGHVLGLDDDGAPGSVMDAHPESASGWGLTEPQKKALMEAYQ